MKCKTRHALLFGGGRVELLAGVSLTFAFSHFDGILEEH
jgi:hypothetical protein